MKSGGQSLLGMFIKTHCQEAQPRQLQSLLGMMFGNYVLMLMLEHALVATSQ